MNEVSIERSLDSIAFEINYYKQQTVQNIIEIGKRLVEAKEKVPHGDWMEWLSDNVNFTTRQAQRFMKVSQELPNTTTSSHLSISQAFEILSLPAEDRTEFIENNDVESMTARELREAIKKQKSLEEDNSKLQKAITELKSQPPSVVEKEIIKEVIPKDYDQLKKNQQSILTKDLKIKKLEDELINRNKKIDNLILKQKEMVDRLPNNEREEKLVNDTWTFVWAIEKLLKDVGGLVYLTQNINELPDHERKIYEKSIENIHGWANQIKFNLEQEKENEK